MKCFLGALVSRGHLDLLAQVGTPLTPSIDKDDRQQCSQCGKKKHFHAPRIARMGHFVPYSEFAHTKQL
jgi:hypothetical protein